MAFEHYIRQGQKWLRCGYTTGTCAALAAKAAVRMLLTGKRTENIAIQTPNGLFVSVPVQEIQMSAECVSCGVIKDAGDDIDVTAGALICVKAQYLEENVILIEGGNGVGRITKSGLEQPIGAAAINSVPRRMIKEEVRTECKAVHWDGGLKITVFVPMGEALATKTFNPNLGIIGGISILGTSGIVEPQSVQALVATIEIEIRQRFAAGAQRLVITPGNYGEDYLRTRPDICSLSPVKCSNYIGEAIDFAVSYGFTELVLVGHMGKLVKLAGGIMNTHSKVADCRNEILTAHAALSGASLDTLNALMEAATTDACIELLDKEGLRQTVMNRLIPKILEHLKKRTGETVLVGVVVFSNRFGLLGEGYQ